MRGFEHTAPRLACAAQAWARRRARQGGLPQPARVALVSAVSGSGVPGLLRMLHEEVGGRGDVWVVRAPGRAPLMWWQFAACLACLGSGLCAHTQVPIKLC